MIHSKQILKLKWNPVFLLSPSGGQSFSVTVQWQRGIPFTSNHLVKTKNKVIQTGKEKHTFFKSEVHNTEKKCMFSTFNLALVKCHDFPFKKA